jgi:hypothetical protein|tara:strand:+ start:339 stop:959 length:621 start_codon:yes stop_codon:yes gene_type:complete
MAVTINGSGTISGIAVGGLPNGIIEKEALAPKCVTTPKIDADAVTAAKIAPGAVSAVYTSHAVICDEKQYNEDGGTFTNGEFRTRDLNTELFDPDGIVSITGNTFTLSAGIYAINWRCPAFDVDKHVSRLYNQTSNSSVSLGSVGYTSASTQDFSFGSARVTTTGDTVFRIEHRCSTTKGTTGFGVAHDISDINTRYTYVEIFMEA